MAKRGRPPGKMSEHAKAIRRMTREKRVMTPEQLDQLAKARPSYKLGLALAQIDDLRSELDSFAADRKLLQKLLPYLNGEPIPGTPESHRSLSKRVIKRLRVAVNLDSFSTDEVELEGRTQAKTFRGRSIE